MIQNVLEEIGGIGIYGVISICLFFAVFTGVLMMSMRMNKSVVRKMGALPLDDGRVVPERSGGAHER